MEQEKRTRIFLSNLGYARGINGCLMHHVRYLHRHIYCNALVQQQALNQLRAVMVTETPDICCFVELDKGSFDTANFDQMEHLLSDDYPYYDIENKYAHKSFLRTLAFTRGKSNAFMAKYPYSFEKVYFPHGTKRLIYKVYLSDSLTLFFSHFSLKYATRIKQLHFVGELIAQEITQRREVIFMGDFNILTGLKELAPLMEGDGMKLVNREDEPTFTFHKRRLLLDLCLATPRIRDRISLRIIPQPYSDHAALLAEVTHD